VLESDRRKAKLLMKGLTILVTGGAGFIGSHLTERLLALESKVIVLDNYSAANRGNLDGIASNPKLTVVEGDILNARTVDRLVKKADYVFHLACKVIGLSLVEPKIVHEVNATGTLNVCMACRRHESERLVYVSSSEVYGTAKYVPMDENHPFCPTTPYGASKAAGELYVQSFYHTWNLPAVIARPFNTYGPRSRTDQYSAVIRRFIDRLLKDKPPIIYGDGKQTRDFTYVSDVVDGIIKTAECDKLVGEAVNIARGEEVSIVKVADIVSKLLGKKGRIEPIFEEQRPGDVRRHIADISKAQKLLKFKPEVSIEDGIERLIEWRKAQEE
jgi:UDP-glucose 4-epimerase